MPELPEVETIVRDLNRKVLGRAFVDVWTDWKKMIHLRQGFGGQVKKPDSFKKFKKEIKGKKIKKVWRRGKNILFELSEGKTLLIHQKLTGHLLLGDWKREVKAWRPIKPGPLEDPINRFLHLIFWLDNKHHLSIPKQLALSDLRKFAKVELWNSQELKESKEFTGLGPEPLEESFTFQKFQEILKKEKRKIKQVLMDQTVIAGIGNIYSDEILFEAKIRPLKEAPRLTLAELKRIYQAIKKILKKAVELRGTSISDFRDLEGKRGSFGKVRKVYRKDGEKCPRCSAKIKRIKLAGRSAHFCPKCQK